MIPAMRDALNRLEVALLEVVNPPATG